MNVLFVGDIVGKGGRKAVESLVPLLRHEFVCSFCIANAENIAGGAGVTKKCLETLKDYVDVFTLGDHVWDQKGFDTEIKSEKSVIRPANLSKKQPGEGFNIFRIPAGGEIAVINLLGRVFMKDSAFSPFDTVDEILLKIPSRIKTIFVDMHAEATSEKIAMGRYLDGRVTAVLGTHTHVQTADAQIFPGGTAYLTDVGMVGADTSVLGRKVEDVIYKFTTDMPCRLSVVENGLIRLDAAVVTFDMHTGKATALKTVSRKIDIP